MDFFTAIIFGTTAGYLVGFIAVPQFAVGILLFGGASYILPWSPTPCWLILRPAGESSPWQWV